MDFSQLETKLAQAAQTITPFHVMDLLAKAKQREAAGQSILHLEVGEPDFPTPEPIVQAGIAALQAGRTHYTAAQGLLELRIAIAEFYQQRYQVSINPERIFMTVGASGALQLVLSALLNPQDEVLLSDPTYPCNRNFVRLLGATPVGIPVDAAHAYQPHLTALETYRTANTRALLLASPANPTGMALGRERLNAYFAWAKQHKIAFILDEIYHGLNYCPDAEPNCVPTALSLAHDAKHDELFVINSFSKYFGMTGWRLGWMVVPEAFIPTMDKLAQNLFLAAPTPAQYAALAAFSEEAQSIMRHQVAVLKERRDYLYDALVGLGFDLAEKPQGGFYLYADCQRFTDDSYAFCYDLLDKTGVAITPGIDFGDYRANQYVRFAYTLPLPTLRKAVGRLRDYLQAQT
ncbi:MAG TPA: aminotransferase class I/II-fold pyridoxal phosphate-dependent enzyme [Thiothrix sp.]|nr:aminotransferase class I/II-fold pyridoxal phosphate-dependent enzyme [Thiothrix sp.]